jgi:hypothetical protein
MAGMNMKIENLKAAKNILDQIDLIDEKLSKLESKIGNNFSINFTQDGCGRVVAVNPEFGRLALRVVVTDLRLNRRKLEQEAERL